MIKLLIILLILIHFIINYWTCVCLVVTPDVSSCRQRSPLLLTSTSGYLSSYVTELTGCGGIDSPWRIRTAPGQTLNITVFDFSSSPASGSVSGTANHGLGKTSACQVYIARCACVICYIFVIYVCYMLYVECYMNY